MLSKDRRRGSGSATLPSYQKALAGVPTLQSELSKVPLSSGGQRP